MVDFSPNVLAWKQLLFPKFGGWTKDYLCAFSEFFNSLYTCHHQLGVYFSRKYILDLVPHAVSYNTIRLPLQRCKMTVMASPIASQQFVQTDNKETSKVCITVLLWGDSTSDWWIPCTKGTVTWKKFQFDDVIVTGQQWVKTYER